MSVRYPLEVAQAMGTAIQAARRQMHLNNHGVGIGPDGKHPGDAPCNLCAALSKLDDAINMKDLNEPEPKMS